jgi:hypothetical protein
MIEAGKRLEMGKGKLDIWRSLSQLVPQGTDSVADCINLFNFYQLYYVNILGNPPYDSSYSKAILAAWAAKYPKFGAE